MTADTHPSTARPTPPGPDPDTVHGDAPARRATSNDSVPLDAAQRGHGPGDQISAGAEEAYLRCLGELHDARRSHTTAEQETRRRRDELTARLAAYDPRLADQTAALTALAHDLHEPPPHLTPDPAPDPASEVATVPWNGFAQLDDAVRRAQTAMGTVVDLGRRPRLFPLCRSRQARNALVYWACTWPFTYYMTLTCIFPTTTVIQWSLPAWIAWGLIIQPALTAIGGTALIRYACTAPLPATPPPGEVRATTTARPLPSPPRAAEDDPKPHPILGALIAAGWWYLLWQTLIALTGA